MLSQLTIEAITTDTTRIYYCDCTPDCLERITLPDETYQMLMADPTLILLIGLHKSDRAGAVVVESKRAWKVCKVKQGS